MSTMKKREKDLLLELIRKSKQSDRELATKLKTSQSTITRTRHRLEKKIIRAYTVIPNFSEIDINLIVFTVCKCDEPNNEFHKTLKKFIDDHPCIAFMSRGEGMGTKIMVSFHSDFDGYQDFMRETRRIFNKHITGLKSIITSTRNITKELDLYRPVRHFLEENR
jgi:DNA-binding Lrp family transcriptional regulator